MSCVNYIIGKKRRGLSLQVNFRKVGALRGSQFWEGSWWERGGEAFLMTKNLIKKKFFSVITKNLNLESLTKNSVTFDILMHTMWWKALKAKIKQINNSKKVIAEFFKNSSRKFNFPSLKTLEQHNIQILSTTHLSFNLLRKNLQLKGVW